MDVVLGLARSNDSDNNAGGSVATGSARQVTGDDLDYKEYLGPPGWGVGRVVDDPMSLKSLPRNLKRWSRPTQGCTAKRRRKRPDKSCVKIRALALALLRAVAMCSAVLFTAPRYRI